MTAQQAKVVYDISVKISSERFSPNQLDNILAMIHKASTGSNGLFPRDYIEFSDPIEIETQIALEALGYEITRNNYGGEKSFTKISWV